MSIIIRVYQGYNMACGYVLCVLIRPHRKCSQLLINKPKSSNIRNALEKKQFVCLKSTYSTDRGPVFRDHGLYVVYI